ncbi:MAG: hypothetical protein IJG45_07325 [Oscillospiraceae bacterium]|nr:hypothetical protein [Oscillospiraceae bacterium]
MKKLLVAGLLILALCLTLVACGDSKPAETPPATDAPAAPEAGSVSEKLASYGFSDLDFVVHSQDYIELDQDGDIILHSTAPYEDVAKACYDACKKASDDGVVRDYWTEEPIDFAFEDAEMIWYGYMRNGEFEDLAFGPYWSDQETGYTDYLLQWD